MRRPMMYTASLFAVVIIVLFYLGVPEKYTRSSLDKLVGTNIDLSVEIITKEVDRVTSIDGMDQIRTTIKAKIKTVNGVPLKKSEKILIKYYGHTEYIPGQSIDISGIVEKPQCRRNPGCFDYALYLKSIGINYTFDAKHIGIDTTEKMNALDKFCSTVQMKLYGVREQFISDIEVYVGKDMAGMIRAMMFGSKTGIDEECLEEFQKNGTAHVLAVSGLHIGIIYSLLCALWKWKKGKVFFAAVIVLFMTYMIMASFSPSVVRAVIMVWLHVIATLTNRRYDMASAAFFTAFLMMAVNPMHLFNTGFQMSFLAVLTLSLMMPIVKKIYSGIFITSIAVQAGLLPYTIYVFNYISVAALFVNVPIIYLTAIIVPMGMCTMVVSFVFKPLFEVLIQSLGGLCTIMIRLNDMTAIDGITVFNLASPPIWIVALYYLTLLVFVSEDGRLLFMRKKYGLIKRLVIGVIITSLAFGYVAGNQYKKSDMVFVDVGQGDCMHIRTEREGDYLVDGGGSLNYNVGKKILKPYLLKNGVTSVDGAFITHLHTDHYKGIAELCRDGMIKKIYMYEGYRVKEAEIVKETGLESENITYLHAGQKVALSNNAFVEVLWPQKRSFKEYEKLAEVEEDENQFSLILKVTVKNQTMLVTGDVDADCLDTLTKKHGENMDIDILKVAHHGSKYSDSEIFIEAAKPEFAVFQVGKNNFGHPNEGIVEKLRRKGIMIYRNDLNGAVAFDLGRNGKIKVKNLIGE